MNKMNDQIDVKYEDGNFVEIGDRITLDGHEGVVIEILLPRSQRAKDFSCFDEGGLLLQMKYYGLLVEPFGVTGRIEKIIHD